MLFRRDKKGERGPERTSQNLILKVGMKKRGDRKSSKRERWLQRQERSERTGGNGGYSKDIATPKRSWVERSGPEKKT